MCIHKMATKWFMISGYHSTYCDEHLITVRGVFVMHIDQACQGRKRTHEFLYTSFTEQWWCREINSSMSYKSKVGLPWYTVQDLHFLGNWCCHPRDSHLLSFPGVYSFLTKLPSGVARVTMKLQHTKVSPGHHFAMPCWLTEWHCLSTVCFFSPDFPCRNAEIWIREMKFQGYWSWVKMALVPCWNSVLHRLNSNRKVTCTIHGGGTCIVVRCCTMLYPSKWPGGYKWCHQTMARLGRLPSQVRLVAKEVVQLIALGVSWQNSCPISENINWWKSIG